jgi:hypothetical protein
MRTGNSFSESRHVQTADFTWHSEKNALGFSKTRSENMRGAVITLHDIQANYGSFIVIVQLLRLMHI